MAPTTMKCPLPNVHMSYFSCIGFSFSGCYLSQHLSQNNILLTTINSLLRRPSKTAQPLVHADRPKPPSKITVRGPFVYRDRIPLLL